MHNSMISLDWAGTYHGVVPCADCEGVETKISLSDDQSYQIERIYLGRSDQVFLNEGTFTWSDDGSRIELNNVDPSHAPGTYQVGENRLFQLDMNGNRIDGDLAERYVLTKVFDNLSGLNWKLIELEGGRIHKNSETLRTPILQFISDGNRISGNGGCNQFNGNYEIKSDNGISFDDIASTKMACDQMEIENKFFNALEEANTYTLTHDTLSLNQSDQIHIARFLLQDE
tara:strand:- start:39474 stop:40160 length:687 start_codon:yes stop_codon:yes gene_type:complete